VPSLTRQGRANLQRRSVRGRPSRSIAACAVSIETLVGSCGQQTRFITPQFSRCQLPAGDAFDARVAGFAGDEFFTQEHTDDIYTFS
jgi:hypothetical protein